MAKWHGVLGFAEPEQETAPGVWEPPKVIERTYYGEVPRKKLSMQSAEKLVDDISKGDLWGAAQDIGENIYNKAEVTLSKGKEIWDEYFCWVPFGH